MSRLEKNPLEWAVFTFGMASVVAILGFLIWDAATARGGAPELHVELGSPVPGSSGFTVPVTVRNQGDETAEGVLVVVTLDLAGGPHETAEIEMAFVPRRSQREGWVTFRSDPRQGHLSGRAMGYEKP